MKPGPAHTIAGMMAAPSLPDGYTPATARLPMILLHLLAMALQACILIGTMLSMYWSFSDEVSSYRRRMNAAADRAQIFFDQRETLLRAVASSSVRNTDRMPAQHTPWTFGQTGQVNVIPLMNGADSYDWALILTRRNRADVAAANARIVYTTLAGPGSTRLAVDDTRLGGHHSGRHRLSVSVYAARRGWQRADLGRTRSRRHRLRHHSGTRQRRRKLCALRQ